MTRVTVQAIVNGQYQELGTKTLENGVKIELDKNGLFSRDRVIILINKVD